MPHLAHIYNLLNAKESEGERATKVVVSQEVYESMKIQAHDYRMRCGFGRALEPPPDVETVYGLPLTVGDTPATGVRVE